MQVEEHDDDGVIRTAIVQTWGSRFDSDPTDHHYRVGTVELIPQESCDRLALHYAFDDTEAVGAFRGLTGEIQLRRIDDCAPRPDTCRAGARTRVDGSS